MGDKVGGMRCRRSRASPMLGARHSGPDRIIDAIRQALVVLDEKLRVIAANRAFYRAFDVMPEETIGRHLADVGDHRLDVPALRGFARSAPSRRRRHRGL